LPRSLLWPQAASGCPHNSQATQAAQKTDTHAQLAVRPGWRCTCGWCSDPCPSVRRTRRALT
jgi:hypothetical protein